MIRKIISILLYLFSVILILLGVLSFVYSPSPGSSDLPGWCYFLQFCFNVGFIALGILSWTRANCFRSTWRAFLYLLLRIITFILASSFSSGPESAFEDPISDSDSWKQTVEALFWIYFACVFFWLTILLTLANKDRSVNKTSLTLANKYKSAKRSAHRLEGRYIIDPRDFGKDRVYIGVLVGFWLFWVPMTALVTCFVYTETDPHAILYLWLVIAYLAIILIPLSLSNMNKKQILEVSGDSLVVHDPMALPGYPGYRIEIDKLNLQALTLEFYGEISSERESVYSLNLIQKGSLWPKRIMLAPFVHPQDKAILFEEIRDFLLKNGFKFETKNGMANPAKTIECFQKGEVL